MKKGQKMPEKLRLRMIGNQHGKANKGRKFKPETLEKMSKAKKGKSSNAKGLKHSTESRHKMSEARKLFILREDPNHSFEIYDDDRKKVRRERIKQYDGFHSIGEWETLKAQYNWNCPSCKKSEPEIKLTRDHIIAISKGGSDNIENIQPLCKSCNSKKSVQMIRY